MLPLARAIATPIGVWTTPKTETLGGHRLASAGVARTDEVS